MEAYDAVPQLHARGEGVVQNIRKRAREERAKAAPAPAPAAKITKKKAAKKPRPLPKGKRLRSDQVDAIAAEKVAKRQSRSSAHKQATKELAASIDTSGGRAPNGKKKEIADRINREHGLSPNSALTPRGISEAVARGKAGESPEVPGRKSETPKELAKGLGIRAQLLQLSGQEQGSRKLLASAMAYIAGTDLEGLLDSKGKRLRMVRAMKAACQQLSTKQRKSSDDRRAEWLCRSRLRWFIGYVRALKEAGFIEPKPGNPLFIPPWKLRRMSNSSYRPRPPETCG